MHWREFVSSLPSTAVSPLLTGTYGEKAGPQIINLVAGDPKTTAVGGYDPGDTITITFDEDSEILLIWTEELIQEILDSVSDPGPIRNKRKKI